MGAVLLTGYCKYCDTLTNAIVEVFEIVSGKKRLAWSGCVDCYDKKQEIMNNEEKNIKRRKSD